MGCVAQQHTQAQHASLRISLHCTLCSSPPVHRHVVGTFNDHHISQLHLFLFSLLYVSPPSSLLPPSPPLSLPFRFFPVLTSTSCSDPPHTLLSSWASMFVCLSSLKWPSDRPQTSFSSPPTSLPVHQALTSHQHVSCQGSTSTSVVNVTSTGGISHVFGGLEIQF